MIKNFHLENQVRFTQHQSHYIKVQKEGFILDGLIFRERGGTLCARDFLGNDIRAQGDHTLLYKLGIKSFFLLSSAWNIHYTSSLCFYKIAVCIAVNSNKKDLILKCFGNLNTKLLCKPSYQKNDHFLEVKFFV